MNPRVSVVIPAYNNADYIEEAVDSVLAQDYDDFELIVADHGSDDGSWDLLQRYSSDSRVTLLQTERGGGAARNWKRVTDAASGEFVKLVCGDDVIHPTALRAQVAALEAAPGAVLCASRRDLILADGTVLVRGRGLAGLEGVVPGTTALRRAVRAGTNIFGEPACVLMRRSVLEAVGGWDETYSYLIDQASYSRVLLRGDFVAVPGVHASFRVSATQWSVALARVQAAEAARYHRALHEARPDVVSRGDVLVGNAAARFVALQRRAVYTYIGLRDRRSGSEK